MKKLSLEIEKKHLNTLFPFYLIVNEMMEIVSVGRSMVKLFPRIKSRGFKDIFKIIRPYRVKPVFAGFEEYENQIFIIESNWNEEILIFRGQFTRVDSDKLMFAGSPWLSDVDDLRKYNLSLTDFALHDPITDMLQVLKIKDIANDDVKSLVKKLNTQKSELKKSQEQFSNLVEGASEGIFKVSQNGHLVYVNPVGKSMLGITIEKSEVIEKDNFISMVRNDFKVRAQEILNACLKGEKEKEYQEWPLFHKGANKMIWAAISIANSIPENNEKDGLQIVVRDITDKKNTEEKYRQIIENMNLGIAEVDNNGIIIRVFDEFCKLLGYTQEELVGNKLNNFVLKEHVEELEQQHKNRESGKSGLYELQMKKKSGEVIWVLISGSPIQNERGITEGSTGIHLDITEQKKLEQSLQEARINAESALKSKEFFLANMSHEIRTPMNAILGMGKLLSEANLTGKYKNYLDSINISAENLLVIINDILDFSKINSGKLEFEQIGFRISPIFDTVIKTIDHKIIEKDVFITCEIDDELLDQVIIGDPVRITQIIMNFASNAAKFTNEGEIILRAKTTMNNSQSIVVDFEVEDSGIGISEDKIKYIFDSFQQADISTTRKFGGTGLGLTICKKLVDQQGGKLKVRSKMGMGSQFSASIMFPLGTEKDVPKNLDVIDRTRLNFKGKKILLVEDHKINQIYAMTILEKWKIYVGLAENGIEAIKMINSEEFDLILMDMQMPLMGGMECTIKLRENQVKIPIIALTASAIKGDEKKCIDAGMNDYVSKPFREEELITVIWKFLGTEEKLEAKFEESIIMKNEPLYDLKSLEDISSGNKEFVERMINIFMTETKKSIQRIENCIMSESWPELGGIMHKMKPSIGMFNITEITNLVAEIEKDAKTNTNILQIPSKSQQVIDICRVVIEQLQARKES